ncbi:hypothetical protein A2U01_0033425, partial [Trifolium medium]|nr:hypothetical protein [Trifolium medium]
KPSPEQEPPKSSCSSTSMMTLSLIATGSVEHWDAYEDSSKLLLECVTCSIGMRSRIRDEAVRLRGLPTKIVLSIYYGSSKLTGIAIHVECFARTVICAMGTLLSSEFLGVN